ATQFSRQSVVSRLAVRRTVRGGGGGERVLVLEWRTGNPACPDRRDRLSPTEFTQSASIRNSLRHRRRARVSVGAGFDSRRLAFFWRRAMAQDDRRVSASVERQRRRLAVTCRRFFHRCD